MPKVQLVCEECNCYFYASLREDYVICPRCKAIIEVDQTYPWDRDDD